MSTQIIQLITAVGSIAFGFFFAVMMFREAVNHAWGAAFGKIKWKAVRTDLILAFGAGCSMFGGLILFFDVVFRWWGL